MAFIGNNPKWNTQTNSPQSADPANPVEGMIFYSDGTSRAKGLYNYKDGQWQPVGNAGAGINYVENSSAEGDVAGWAAYADAAQSTPVDGTGGSATVTITRTTSTPLRGVGSFLLTKDAANRQGEGVSCALLSIDEADNNSVLRISFDYDDTGANYAEGDVRIYIYDITNNALIEPTQRDLEASSIGGKYISEFQTTDSLAYRLILHVATTNASAYSIKFDNVQVGPREIARGPILEDWQNVSLAFNNATFTSSTCRIKQTGDSLEISFVGIPNVVSGNITAILPNSLVADTAKVTVGQSVGFVEGQDAGVQVHTGSVNLLTSSSLIFYGAGGISWNATHPFTWVSGVDVLSFNAKVPIVGWSSNTSISSDFGNRRIAVRGAGNGNTVLTADVTNIDWTEVEDTASSWNGTQFVSPEKGDYNITAHLNFSAAYSGAIDMYVNTTLTKRVGRGSGAADMGISTTVSLNKGDVVSFRASTGATLSTSAVNHNIQIQKIDPRQIFASNAVVVMKARLVNDEAVNAAIIPFDLVDIDTHGTLNTATGVYTIPVSGKYRVSTNSLITAGSQNSVQIRKNTVSIQALFVPSGNTTINTGSTIVDCIKGDAIDIFGVNSVTYDASSAVGPHCSFEIEKIN